MAQKQTVIERLRAAEQYLSKLPGHGGAPYGWLRELISDAMQELQSESGELWLQTVTGLQSHVRMFVAGNMGLREMDLLLEILMLHRSWMRDESDKAADAVDPHVVGTGKLSTRDQSDT